ncbi:L-xylulose/3-keto-L-gulonate kinase, partial [Haemophilus influenzae]
KFRLKKEKL